MHDNPFRPGFGSWPPAFVGREADELLFREGLANGPGSRFHTSLALGPRGVGKTVLLAAFRDIAESEGYVTVAVDANDGMLRRICRDLVLLRDAIEENPQWRVTEVRASGSLGVAGGHIDLTRSTGPALEDDPAVMLKLLLESVHAAVIDRGGAGLLLTVDELHAANVSELERLGNDLQHLQVVAFAGAALPTIDDQIFKATGATFFSRVARLVLEPLPLSVAVAALRPSFDDAGIGYDLAALTRTVRETRGYPYLVQLLGHEIWRRLDPGQDITDVVLADAYEAAREQSILDVLAPTWRQLSPTARRVMGVIAAHGPGPVPVSTVYQALDRTSSWFSVYRARLIRAGMIQSAGRGFVELTGGSQAAEWIAEQLLDD